MNQFELFWEKTKEELREVPLTLSLKEIPYPLLNGKVYRIRYRSLYYEWISGILLLPEKKQCPLVIDYLGYMNYIQEPFHFAHWLNIGCGCLVIDNRDQGGQTKDEAPYEFCYGHMPFGRGFQKKEDFYLRRIIADSLRCVEVAQEIPGIDPAKIILRGGSQGGGMALLVNALTDYPIFATFADVPSHSNIRTRIKEGTGSYRVIHDYLQEFPRVTEKIYQVMDYFDLKHFIKRISNPVFTSVGSCDPICPMKDFTVSYRKLEAPKELWVYWNKKHGGGEGKQIRRELNKILELLQRNESL